MFAVSATADKRSTPDPKLQRNPSELFTDSEPDSPTVVTEIPGPKSRALVNELGKIQVHMS